jgi:hypothetical protein
MAQRFSGKIVAVIFSLVIITVTQAGLRPAEAGGILLPTPESSQVKAAALANDGDRLLVSYLYLGPEIDSVHNCVQTLLSIKEWQGNQWQSLETPWISDYDLYRCGDIHMAVQGNDIAIAWVNDDWKQIHAFTFLQGVWNNPRYYFGSASNYSTPYSPRLTFAFGDPFLAYDDNNGVVLSELPPTSDSFYNNINGHYNVGLTSDANTLYFAFYYINFFDDANSDSIRVVKLTKTSQEFLGAPFKGENYNFPEMTMFSGNPVVAWKDTSANKIYVDQWDGTQWQKIGEGTFSQKIGMLKLKSSADKLYVAYELYDEAPEGLIGEHSIIVNEYDGSTWKAQGITLEASFFTSFRDMAIYQGRPVVAYILFNKIGCAGNSGDLKIVEVTPAPNPKGNIAPIMQL